MLPLTVVAQNSFISNTTDTLICSISNPDRADVKSFLSAPGIKVFPEGLVEFLYTSQYLFSLPCPVPYLGKTRPVGSDNCQVAILGVWVIYGGILLDAEF